MGLAMSTFQFMEFHATRQKVKDFELFSFPIEGKKIFKIAGVSHIRKGEDGETEGFQRPEVKKHINNIAEYIEKPISMIPNAIVLAIEDSDFSFTKIDSQSNAFGDIGILRIPIHVNSETRACLIIDGQQRSKAIEQAKVSTFPIMVCAFHTNDEEVMKEHFYNVNSSKNLPNDLIASLIQGIPMANLIDAMKPAHMAATLVGELSTDKKSPFYTLINDAIYKNGVIPLNSIKKPLENLIDDKTNFIGMNTGSGGIVDKEKIIKKIYTYWTAVSLVFNHAWGEKIRVSRLMHGTGLWALFQLMPKLLDKCSDDPEVDEIQKHLNLIASHCHWTEEDGDWENVDGFGLNIPWNGFENTAKGKSLITGFIFRTYVKELKNAEL
jgi:DGQHR domain-containing protein